MSLELRRPERTSPDIRQVFCRLISGTVVLYPETGCLPRFSGNWNFSRSRDASSFTSEQWEPGKGSRHPSFPFFVQQPQNHSCSGEALPETGILTSSRLSALMERLWPRPCIQEKFQLMLSGGGSGANNHRRN